MSVQPLIEMAGVAFAFPGRPLLFSGLDLSLHPGERLRLFGGNGSGKSTLMRLLVGLLAPSAGEIRVFGRCRRCEEDFAEIRGRVGLLMQNSDDQLFCPTVLDDVAFGPLNLGRPPSEARDIASSSLERVGLSGFEERITHKLSGGEKRLAALATVLAMEPQVLLLDEPVAGLDSQACQRVRSVLGELPQAMLLVSHDRELANGLASRELHLADGCLRAVP